MGKNKKNIKNDVFVEINEEFVKINLDNGFLEKNSLEVNMIFLDAMRKNHTIKNKYFLFDEHTEKYIVDNSQEYELIKNKKNNDYKFYFNNLSNFLNNHKYLYNINDLLLTIKLLLDKEVYLNKNIECNDKILTRIVNENSEKVLKIKDIEKLINTYGKDFVLTLSSYICSNINYHNEMLAKKNNTSFDIVKLSTEIKTLCFDENENKHVLLKNFNDNDYVLKLALDNACNQLSDYNDIMKLLLINKEIVNAYYNNVNNILLSNKNLFDSNYLIHAGSNFDNDLNYILTQDVDYYKCLFLDKENNVIVEKFLDKDVVSNLINLCKSTKKSELNKKNKIKL